VEKIVYEIQISYTKSLEFVYEIQVGLKIRIRWKIPYDEIWGGRNLEPGGFSGRDDPSSTNVSVLDEIRSFGFRLGGRSIVYKRKRFRRNPVFALIFWCSQHCVFVYEIPPRRKFRIRNSWFRIRISARDDGEGSKEVQSHRNRNFRLS
jgi:hypothetical protein